MPALVTTPPYASIIPWCPRQTPSMGSDGPISLITSGQAPKYRLSDGVPGPGEMTTPSYPPLDIAPGVILSLRTTSHPHPKLPRYWAML